MHRFKENHISTETLFEIPSTVTKILQRTVTTLQHQGLPLKRLTETCKSMIEKHDQNFLINFLDLTRRLPPGL